MINCYLQAEKQLFADGMNLNGEISDYQQITK